MANFILIHGMFHGGWSFDKLTPFLDAKDHTVLTPDLAGCGSDETPHGEVSLDGWAKDIAALAESSGKVILLGHSRGGLVAAQATEYAPAYIAATVYLTALMLPSGKSALSVPDIMVEQGFEVPTDFIAPVMTEDGLSMLPPENAAAIFYGNCSQEIREWATPKIGAEPLAPLLTPVTLTPGCFGAVPRIYIETTEDRTLSIQAQRALIAASKPAEVITLETDHMPTMTHVQNWRPSWTALLNATQPEKNFVSALDLGVAAPNTSVRRGSTSWDGALNQK